MDHMIVGNEDELIDASPNVAPLGQSEHGPLQKQFYLKPRSNIMNQYYPQMTSIHDPNQSLS